MTTTTAVKYETAGPLSSVFTSPEARVLDQTLLVGNMEQTIAMLSESTGLSSETVEKVVKKFAAKGWMEPTRKVGAVQAYRFKVENELHELIDWATKFQLSRV